MKTFRMQKRMCSTEPSMKPINLLLKYLNNEVYVRLKDGVEYRGRMLDCDGYMNLVLEDTS